ncbi:MAG: hypothetical protein P8P30_05425 [Rickettsiales bacterium]|nr:hypothetical protein [Rickettsiales bacterium]
MATESGMVIPQQGVIDLKALTEQVMKSSWLVFCFAVMFGFMAFLFAIRPIPYEVHATLNVEPVNMGSILSAGMNIDTEVGRIRSWTTLERVINKMGRYGFVTLKSSSDMPDLSERLKYFLSTGKKHEERKLLPIQVDRLQFPEASNGGVFLLEVTGKNRFKVETSSGEKLFDGRVGEDQRKGGAYYFHVSELNAPIGAIFTIFPLSTETMIERTLASLKVVKRTADRNGSLIDLRFFSKEPYFARHLIETIVQDYVEQAYDRISASKQRAIGDLEKELERSGAKLGTSEELLGSYMKDIDVADVDAEMRGQLEMRLSLEQSLRQVQLQRAQLKQIYTKGHPAMKAAEDKEGQLVDKLTLIQNRLAQLPEIKGKLFTMNRKVKQYATQYDSVLERYTQLKIDASAMNNYVSVVNLARIVRRDLRNKSIQIVVLGVMMGIIIALGLIVLKSNLRANILEHVDQIGIFPTLSVSDLEPGHTQRSYNVKNDENTKAIDDIVAQFSYLASKKKNNITVVTSSKATQRKSRLTLKMAKRFAAKNGKVLLIDANVKHSYLAEYVGITGEEGFANAMVGKMPSTDIIHQIDDSDLYYMSPGNPGMSIQILRDFERFDYLLAEFGKLFDRIIVDLPSQMELPFWQTMVSRTGTTIHFLEKGEHIDYVQQYMHTVSELAKAKPETLHEVLLYTREGEPKSGLFKRA